MKQKPKPSLKNRKNPHQAPREKIRELTRKNHRLVREVEELREKERQLEDRVRFERLLSEISTRLVHLPAELIGRQVEEGLRRVVEFLGVDRGSVYILSGDRKRIPRKYFWGLEGIPESAPVLEDEKFPWLSEKLRKGEMVMIPRVDNLPEEAAQDREELKKLRNLSSLVIPLAAGNNLFGAVTFGAVRNERAWPEDLVQRVRLVGEIFASALARKQSEEALRRAEVEYRTVAEFTYDWEYWANSDGSIRYMSPSCERITGYSPGALIIRPSLIREMILPIDRHIWDQHIRESRRGTPGHEIQFRIRTSNGQVRWIEHACQSVRSPQGEFLGYRVSNRDVTERKLAEEAARKKDASLAEAQRIAHLGSWHWNIETNDLDWSDEVYRIFGLLPHEFGATYDAFLESVHPEDREAVKEAVNRSLTDPSAPYSIEHRVVRPDKSERIVHERGEVTFDDGGRPIRMIGTVHDLTDRKKAEKALGESEAFSRTILASLKDHICILDRYGMILAVNEAWKQFARDNGAPSQNGIGPGGSYFEVCRKALREQDDYAGRALEGIQRVLEGSQENFQMEYPCCSPSEFRWYLMTVMPLRRPSGGVVIAHTDITERKQAEELVQKSQAELRSLSIQLLSAQEEERKRIARELHDGIGQSLSALKFLLENRIQNMEKDSSAENLQPLENMVPMLQNTIEEVRRMQTDLRPPILDDLGILATISWFCREYQKIYPSIRVDRDMETEEKDVPPLLKTVIYRVMQEALNNVAKHSRANRVQLSLFLEEGWIKLLIDDDGLGFDIQDVLSEDRPLRGLGLTSMRERTELSGGSFSLLSRKGKGTVIQASWKL